MSAGEVAGFVLAGGRSSRMGTNKALLPLNGEPLVIRTARAVASAASSAIIVGSPQLYGAFPFSVIPDTVPDSGPLAGIEAALSFSRAEWNLIVACDMPGITAAALTDLIAQRLHFPDADVLIPYLNGRSQPLCAIYRRRALPAIQDALRRGRLKIMDAIQALRAVELPSQDAALFRNVNTPEEWSAFVSR